MIKQEARSAGRATGKQGIDAGERINAVVVDLAPHPEEAFAVIVAGQLLPMRFATRGEAARHLTDLTALDALQAA